MKTENETTLHYAQIRVIGGLCGVKLKARFPLAKLTGCQHGPSTWLVETHARQHGLTGNGNRSPVNSGRQLG